MRTCVWCDKPLPEPTHKGHRRREFCDDRCKQQHYLWHKKMRHDTDMLTETYWKAAYRGLVEQYQLLEKMLQKRNSELAEERERSDILAKGLEYYAQRCDDLQADYTARLRALGMNEQNIREYNDYWKEHTNALHHDEMT